MVNLIVSQSTWEDIERTNSTPKPGGLGYGANTKGSGRAGGILAAGNNARVGSPSLTGGSSADDQITGTESSTHTHTVTTGSESATHTHSFTTVSIGGGGQHENVHPVAVVLKVITI